MPMFDVNTLLTYTFDIPPISAVNSGQTQRSALKGKECC